VNCHVMLIMCIEQSDHTNLTLLPGFALDDGSFVIYSVCGMLLVLGQNWDHVLLCEKVKGLDCIVWVVRKANEVIAREVQIHGR
jgi:hypothetical protein